MELGSSVVGVVALKGVDITVRKHVDQRVKEVVHLNPNGGSYSFLEHSTRPLDVVLESSVQVTL
jgi:hypothetical protein